MLYGITKISVSVFLDKVIPGQHLARAARTREQSLDKRTRLEPRLALKIVAVHLQTRVPPSAPQYIAVKVALKEQKVIM